MRTKIKLRQARVRRRRAAVADDERLLTPGVAYARPAHAQLAAEPASWRATDLLGLQHRAGNRAVGHLLGRQPAPLPSVTLSPQRQREQAVLTWPLRRVRQNSLQRISIPRTATADPDWKMVPREHLARVRAAVAIINQKVRSRRLITYFRDNAPGGTLNTLQQVANRAQVWELRSEGSQGLSEQGGRNMAYDTLIYRIGRWQIAATLLHEMGHLSGLTGAEADERRCEGAIDAARVYAPFIESVRPRQAAPGDEVTISGMSFGPSQESTDRVTIGGVDAGRATAWEWRHAGGGTIRVRVPTGAHSGELVVENNRIPSNRVPLRIREPAPAP